MNGWRSAFRLRLFSIQQFRRSNRTSSAWLRPSQLLLPQGTADRSGLSRFSAVTGPLRQATKRRNSRFFSKVVDDEDITVLSTPNSNALKFIPGCDVTKSMSTTFTVKKRSRSGTELENPLCEMLLALDGVSSVICCFHTHSADTSKVILTCRADFRAGPDHRVGDGRSCSDTISSRYVPDIMPIASHGQSGQQSNFITTSLSLNAAHTLECMVVRRAGDQGRGRLVGSARSSHHGRHRALRRTGASRILPRYAAAAPLQLAGP